MNKCVSTLMRLAQQYMSTVHPAVGAVSAPGYAKIAGKVPTDGGELCDVHLTFTPGDYSNTANLRIWYPAYPGTAQELVVNRETLILKLLDAAAYTVDSAATYAQLTTPPKRDSAELGSVKVSLLEQISRQGISLESRTWVAEAREDYVNALSYLIDDWLDDEGAAEEVFLELRPYAGEEVAGWSCWSEGLYDWLYSAVYDNCALGHDDGGAEFNLPPAPNSVRRRFESALHALLVEGLDLSGAAWTETGRVIHVTREGDACFAQMPPGQPYHPDIFREETDCD